MRVYLAARYSTKAIIREYAKELRDNGIICTSDWLDEPHAPEATLSETTDSQKEEYAFRDLVDVDESDWLVLFTISSTQPFVRGGRHVEFGYALGKGIPVLVVGPRENIFCYLSSIRRVDTWTEALSFLKQELVRQAQLQSAAH